MIVRNDIVQGTEDWLRLKWGKVGGTGSKGLFVPSDTLLLELLSEHTEEFEMDEDDYVSKDMIRGIELEPMHRGEIEKYTGLKFNVPGWLQCEEILILGISPDGLTEDETISWEGKCPGAKKHIATVYANDIPSDNIHQCLHNFTINPKLVTHIFSSFRPESKYPLWVKKLTRDSLIDLGTKSKPNVKSVADWVSIAKGNALKLEAELQIVLNKLEKI